MIKIENLSKSYDAGQENEVVALDHVSLELQDGTFLGITGALDVENPHCCGLWQELTAQMRGSMR